MRTRRHPLLLAIAIATIFLAMLLIAACNNDDGDDSADEPPTPTEQPEEATPTPGDTPAPDPVETPDQEDSTPTPEPTPEPTVTPTPVEDEDEDPDDEGRASVLVYLVRGEEIAVASRDIVPTQEVATGAINELLTGTTGFEEDIGLHSEVPMETRLLGISIDDGLAIVDLSSDFEAGGGSFSMSMRVAQIVFTVTQFDTVDEVRIRIEGQDVESIGGEGVMVDQPLERDDFEDQTPAILVESPTPGEVVTSPLRLAGSAMTFEATFQYEIVDNSGEIILEDFATSVGETGLRGEFDFEVPFELTREGFGSVIVYEESARDGSRVNVVEIPVDFRE